MTEEEKQLLLKDLCARLPYRVKVGDDLGRIYELHIGNAYLIDLFCENGDYVEPPIKPYLRPMSSMEDKENEHYVYGLTYGDFIDSEKYACDLLDWLNANHFDYRGLIEKGLALKAPEGMYNFK